jgi:hypothetical protein
MGCKRLRQPAGDPAHEVGRVPVKAIDPLREVQRFLNLPDLIVPVGWQDARRVAHRDPSDRHRGARLEACAQVDGGVHSHFAAASEHGAWKIAAPVATNTSSPSVAPVTCAVGPIQYSVTPVRRMTAMAATGTHRRFDDVCSYVGSWG